MQEWIGEDGTKAWMEGKEGAGWLLYLFRPGKLRLDKRIMNMWWRLIEKPEMECTYRKWAGLVQHHELLAAVNDVDGFRENRSLVPGTRITFNKTKETFRGRWWLKKSDYYYYCCHFIIIILINAASAFKTELFVFVLLLDL